MLLLESFRKLSGVLVVGLNYFILNGFGLGVAYSLIFCDGFLMILSLVSRYFVGLYCGCVP